MDTKNPPPNPRCPSCGGTGADHDGAGMGPCACVDPRWKAAEDHVWCERYEALVAGYEHLGDEPDPVLRATRETDAALEAGELDAAIGDEYARRLYPATTRVQREIEQRQQALRAVVS